MAFRRAQSARMHTQPILSDSFLSNQGSHMLLHMWIKKGSYPASLLAAGQTGQPDVAALKNTILKPG